MNTIPSPGLRFRRVAIVAKDGPREGPAVARVLGDWLEAHGITVYYDRRTAERLSRDDGFERGAWPERCDLAVVAGGDGTLLSVAREAIPAGLPILGVNLGSLGFLTELQPEELEGGLERMLGGDYQIEERMVLDVSYPGEDGKPQRLSLLNDTVVTKGALARMISLEVCVDDERVATYTSDGLIVSTPTGSTAYALSAGGPILDPRMDAFIVAPICPHTMTYRPLVVPGDVTLTVVLRKGSDSVFLTLDGQVGVPLAEGAEVRIRADPRRVKLIRVAGRGFFEVLRRKLRWGER